MTPPRWSDVPLQVLTVPACPVCGDATEKPILVRSSRAADGATWQRCVCRKCSHRWQRVFLPNSGKLAE
jgi:DNA-directed RNA polymerase subunit M/transcription elongation factor TFIIS